MGMLDGRRILIMATDGFEQSELEVPLMTLRAEGAMVHLAAPEGTRIAGQICGWQGGPQAHWGDSKVVDLRLSDVHSDDYDALVIPGGVMNPDKLRTNSRALELVHEFIDAGKVVAAVCHGPWLLAEADVVQGRTLTSFPSIKTDLINAGATWVDEEVVSDNGIITSRNPGDLAAFCERIIDEINAGERMGGGGLISRIANAVGI